MSRGESTGSGDLMIRGFSLVLYFHQACVEPALEGDES